MANLKRLDELVRERFAKSKSERSKSRLHIFSGDPIGAEPDQMRASRYSFHKKNGAESLKGDSIDFLPSWFLEVGAIRARAVAILRAGGSARGTGFLISPNLLITNNHVLDDSASAVHFTAEFNYETSEGEKNEAPTGFALDADSFWLTSNFENLDFTVIALGERRFGSLPSSDFGYLPLNDRPDKHSLGMCVNIVQHPLGRRKQIVVRENRLLARGGQDGGLANRTLHYSADTDEGASGSPVFNDNWEVVALHHWGIPHLDVVTVDGVPIPQTVNEGIRTSVIVASLKAAISELGDNQRLMLRAALALGDRNAVPAPKSPTSFNGSEVTKPQGEPSSQRIAIAALSTARMQDSNEAVQTFNVPLEITARILGGIVDERSGLQSTTAGGLFGSYAEKIKLDANYANRNGYKPDFIDGIFIPLADVVRPRESEIAPLSDGSMGDSAILQYQNFSLVLSASRRLALCTATNIDAETYLEIDRDTGLPKVGAEGESWFDDKRIDRQYFVGQSFYSDWSVYFDRGHLTRRTDPTWGTEQEAIRANADTYHRTNCAPQHFRFNQSIKYWQGVERYILEYGVRKTKRRVTVLTGPVLDDQFRQYGDLQVPLQYWKVVVRNAKTGAVEVTALLVDQEPLLKEKRVFIKQGAEQAPDVDAFRVSVAHLSAVTGLDFGVLEPFDTFKRPPSEEGAEAASVRVVAGWEDLL